MMKLVITVLVFVLFASCSTSNKRSAGAYSASPDVIRMTLMDNLPDFIKCADSCMRTRSNKIIHLKFKITSAGVVSNANVESEDNSAPRKSLNCMRDHLSQIKFPPLRGKNSKYIDVFQPMNLFPKRE